MLYRDRKGRTFRGNEKQDRFLRAVYGSAPGRLVLKLLIQPGVSRFCGVILSSRISALGAAALWGLGSGQEAAAAPAHDGAFGYGVASGDPTGDSVIIWTRFTPRVDGEPALPGSGQGAPR